MPFTIPSPERHLRHSHHLQTQPPSSFKQPQTSTTGFKNSLRKIPSALFAREPKDTLPPSQPKPRVDNIKFTKTPFIPPSLAPDGKKKAKPRRALADILHWGNNSNPSDAPKPRPLPQPEMSRKPNPPAPIKSAHTGLSGWATLKPASDSVAEVVRRPSCGDDPFGRSPRGAKVVDHVIKPVTKPASVKTIEAERRSLSSVKALSTKTATTADDGSTKGPSDYTLPRLPSSTPPQKRHVSEPMRPAPVPLANLPTRSASLGRTLDASKGQIHRAPSPVPETVKVVVPVPQSQDLDKTLKREKTKSKVWGIFSGTRSKKTKSKNGDDRFEIVHPVASVRETRAVDMHQVVEKAEQQGSTRPRPPALHVIQPSVDLSKPTNSVRSSMTRPEIDLNSPFVVNDGSTSSGRVWETIVGSTADRPSLEGPKDAVPKILPKRKSLSGIFGTGVKKSLDKIRSSPTHVKRDDKRPPPLVLRSLAEEIETADKGGKVSPLLSAGLAWNPFSAKRQVDISTVTSATSQLFDLISTFNLSASSSPASGRSPLAATSMQSLRGAARTSPSPVRKVRSAMLLSSKANPTARVSPLKYALHRAAADLDGSPLRSRSTAQSSPVSMVRKGMRNVFAPPSPCVARNDKPVELLYNRNSELLSATESTISTTMITTRVILDTDDTDLPSDLRPHLPEFPTSPTISPSTNLPSRPARNPNRPVSTRRDRRALGPDEDTLLAHTSAGRVSHVPPHISIDLGTPISPRDSMLTGFLSPTFGLTTGSREDSRQSFDFTEEYAKLDTGDQRASFVEAVRMHQGKAVDMPPLPPLPFFPTPEEELRSPTEKPGPFMGEFAFQQRVSQAKAANQQAFISQPPQIALPPLPMVPAPRRHRRDESGLSILSMSSLGAPIDSGIAGDYTNYFEREFATAVPDPMPAISRQTSCDSFGSEGSRPHHRRNSSICSVDSVAGAEISFVTSGPPISMHNAKRSSYISKHRRDSSVDSVVRGRPDWAAHRRNSSSVESVASLARIGRPGLGARMFQLDGGVQLTSITGSPADDTVEMKPESEVEASPAKSLTHEDSFYNHENRHLSWTDSSVDSQFDSPATDSVFGADHILPPSSFFLRGPRPVSTVSAASSDAGEDTFINVAKYAHKAVAREQHCIQGQGEDVSTPVHSPEVNGRLVGSIQRPPRPATRRRPAHLVIADEMQTPGLTSPSASETSSRLSLDTRFSETSSTVIPGDRIRPFGGGHARQKSSVNVKVDKTIREEPSMATLRANQSPIVHVAKKVSQWDVQREAEELATVNTWRDWRREADDEYRRTQSVWVDSDESKQAVAEFKLPMTQDEISAFLALSSQQYKPLDQLPLGRIAHRRKSSLNTSRDRASPYGLPLPPRDGHPFQTKKGSLITKFERTNSASTASFGFSDDEPTPPSAVFAQFARAHVPPSPTSARSAPEHTVFPDHAIPGVSTKRISDDPLANRMRVASAVRRKNLGWARRRNSDGPAKVAASDTVPVIEPTPAPSPTASSDWLADAVSELGDPTFPIHEMIKAHPSPLKPQQSLDVTRPLQVKSRAKLRPKSKVGEVEQESIPGLVQGLARGMGPGLAPRSGLRIKSKAKSLNGIYDENSSSPVKKAVYPSFIVAKDAGPHKSSRAVSSRKGAKQPLLASRPVLRV